MGEAARLVVGFSGHVFTVLFALGSLLLQLFVPYRSYARFLKWLTLTLLAYVAVLLFVKLDWAAVAKGLVWPVIADRSPIAGQTRPLATPAQSSFTKKRRAT